MAFELLKKQRQAPEGGGLDGLGTFFFHRLLGPTPPPPKKKKQMKKHIIFPSVFFCFFFLGGWVLTIYDFCLLLALRAHACLPRNEEWPDTLHLGANGTQIPVSRSPKTDSTRLGG